RAVADDVAFDPLEAIRDGSGGGAGDPGARNREQHVVLLVDVRTHQRGVPTDGGAKRLQVVGRRRGRNRRDVGAPFFVLVLQDAGRTTFVGHAGGDERREQAVLLLAVVAAVGELYQEVDDVGPEDRVRTRVCGVERDADLHR